MTDIERLSEIVAKSRRLVFFGGAGVSTESGIPDFRSPDGLYNQKYDYPPEEILSGDFFKSYPEVFYRFYREKMLFPDKKPNAAHFKLAELEQKGILACIVTQNIDGFHTMAGSKNVIELHGSVHRNTCLRCSRKFVLDYILDADGVPKCPCGGTIKPDVVLYGEGLDSLNLERAVDYISHADTLIVGGTSLNVYPAAGLVRYFRGAHLILINREPTQLDSACELVFRTPIGEVMAKIVI